MAHKLKDLIVREEAAHLAEITIVLPPVQKLYSSEEVAGLLDKQRNMIAERIRGLEMGN